MVVRIGVSGGVGMVTGIVEVFGVNADGRVCGGIFDGDGDSNIGFWYGSGTVAWATTGIAYVEFANVSGESSGGSGLDARVDNIVLLLAGRMVVADGGSHDGGSGVSSIVG